MPRGDRKLKQEKLLEEIEKLRSELEQKSSLVALTAREVLLISEKLDDLINRYLRLKTQENDCPKKDGG